MQEIKLPKLRKIEMQDGRRVQRKKILLLSDDL